MSDRLLATLATTADIEGFIESKTWEPMLLTKEMRDVGRIEIVNIATARATHGFSIKDWVAIDEARNLFAPVVSEVDCYFDPLQFNNNFASVISQAVFGHPVGAAMHLLHEAHIHEMSIWTEANSSDKAYDAIMKQCAQNSRKLRNERAFSASMSLIPQAVKTWEDKVIDGQIPSAIAKKNTWGVVAPDNWII